MEKEGYTVLTVTTTFDPRRGTLIDTDGGILYVLPENGEAFTLAELYRYLDCSLIEVIRLTPEKIMIVDEEGKFKEDAQVNLRASRIAHWHDAIYPTDCVVGKVIICHTETLK